MYAYIDKINAISTTIYSIFCSYRIAFQQQPYRSHMLLSSSLQQNAILKPSIHGIYICHNLSSHTSFSSACFHCCKTITINSFSCETITSFRAVLTRRSRKSSLGSRSRATLVARDASLVRFCDEENEIEMMLRDDGACSESKRRAKESG